MGWQEKIFTLKHGDDFITTTGDGKGMERQRKSLCREFETRELARTIISSMYSSEVIQQGWLSPAEK